MQSGWPTPGASSAIGGVRQPGRQLRYPAAPRVSSARLPPPHRASPSAGGRRLPPPPRANGIPASRQPTLRPALLKARTKRAGRLTSRQGWQTGARKSGQGRGLSLASWAAEKDKAAAPRGSRSGAPSKQEGPRVAEAASAAANLGQELKRAPAGEGVQRQSRSTACSWRGRKSAESGLLGRVSRT